MMINHGKFGASTCFSLYSVFFPLKMTGLDLDKDQIIEMACIITDCELNIIAEGPTMIINQPDELLDRMSDWCKEHHGKVATHPKHLQMISVGICYLFKGMIRKQSNEKKKRLNFYTFLGEQRMWELSSREWNHWYDPVLI
uniref:Exonuclease domain-containing protein n=1 Tax=Fundulus heteroclitus TaxID=8078 RepID=A0A3Q2Q3I9_FUNHE